MSFQSERWVQARFSVFFERQTEIRRRATALEDALRYHYGPPLVLPIPDEMGPELPRLIFTSTHGFSQVLASQINLVVQVRFSPDWQTEPDRVRTYLDERSALLFETVSGLGVTPLFCGFGVVARLPSSEDDASVIAAVARRLGVGLGEVPELRDLELKKVYVPEEDVFANVTVRNYRTVELEGGEEPLRRVPDRATRERGAEILGDVNDRRAFNEGSDYTSKPEVRGRLLRITFAEMESVIRTLREV